MQAVCEGEPVQSFKVPEGIMFIRINPETGLPPQTQQEEAVFECFKEGQLPLALQHTVENTAEGTAEDTTREEPLTE